MNMHRVYEFSAYAIGLGLVGCQFFDQALPLEESAPSDTSATTTSAAGGAAGGGRAKGGSVGDGGSARSDGDKCQEGQQCASLSCVDGVCCDTACDGGCEACDTGVCAPIWDGVDGVGGGPVCVPPPTNHWTFDDADVDGTTLKDVGTGGGINLECTGVMSTAGKFGEAFAFIATEKDFCTRPHADIVGSPLEFTLEKAFSLSLWWKTTLLGAGSLLGQRLSTDTYRGMSLGIAQSIPGTLGLTLVHDDPMLESLWVRSQGTYSDDKWHHGLVTYDGSGLATGMRIYVDGQLNDAIETDSIVGLPIANTAPFNLGRIGTGNGMGAEVYYTGALDDLAVWSNDVLTSFQANELYSAGSPARK